MDVEEKDDPNNKDQEMESLAEFSPGGNPRAVLAEWISKMEADSLEVSDFKDHWKKFVPRMYALEPGCDWNIEEKADNALIEVLESFIANGNFEEAVRKMKEGDKPPSVCGRVFKHGEPTYSCRECGMDSTCVLCVNCFKKSPHRNHNYKMGTSSGGGCCDCGDVEAWKSEPYCDFHLLGSQVTEAWPSAMSDDMAARCRIAFTAILRYAYQILTLQHSPRLPQDLRPELCIDSEIYCTVLYNDEIHTFDQVINVLSKIVRCSQKDAIEFVTGIDREGRAVVKCGTFVHCQELKTDVETFTTRHGGQILRVDVVETHVIAHQVFAMHLLKWLQDVLAMSESFRTLFTEVALKPSPPETSIVEGVLLRDVVLWKSARSHWHRIFISGMLMEYPNKMAFAEVFTKNYGNVIKDFIRDDHEHSFSIASLSVQIFTVPTLTLHLIAHQEVLFILLNTFLSECNPKLKDSKLLFERNGSMQPFKRAQYILYDLRYLLGNVPTPEQWDNSLRKGFLQGLDLFLRLMSYMEGMDAATRQTVAHMEFEPEWESAFNLHIKLSYVITQLVEWCGSDKVVLVKAFRACLRTMPYADKDITWCVQELANHSVSCINYDVSKEPVSLHLPLSRFYAGLYLHLEKHGLSFDSPELTMVPNRATPAQLIEPILRTQVMIGQVHAGMWRRNGYSILNQLYFYHNVRCRTEMLDRDVVMMQIGASLIESDEFLMHVIYKYGLMPWADPKYEENAEEESMRQTISLVEEMLGLLVTIIGERWVPGVGDVKHDDRIKKEVIQQLCIKPLSHSELNKTLPDDVNHETGLERIIDDVATFRKPDGSGKGVYRLKDEFYDQYNLFFYHYTREELSKSEDAQRSRRKAKQQLECCPPPPLPPLTAPFESLPNLLQCDVMMHILQTVLSRSLNLRARSFSENQLQKALHLIGFALQEEQTQRYPYLRFAEKSVKWNIEQLVTELSTSARVESHKDMMLWIIERFKTTKEEQEVKPVAPPSDKDLKEWRSKMAAEKRAKVMAQMAAMQSSFLKGNEYLLKKDDEEEEENDDPMKALTGATHTCILCQQQTVVKREGPALVLCVLLQRSTVHVVDRKKHDKADEVLTKPMFRPTSTRPQLHTSTCGHVMHHSCWQSYFNNVLAKESRRPYRLRQPTSFDVEKQEFLCPLCECLGNSVIPLLPPPPVSSNSPAMSFKVFLRGLKATVTAKVSDDDVTYHAPTLDQVCAELTEEPSWRNLFSEAGEIPNLDSSLKEMSMHFCDSVYSKGLNVDPTRSPFTPMLIWNTTYYTFLSTEAMLADKPLLGGLPMRQDSCLEALISMGVWLPSVLTQRSISDQALYLLSAVFDNSPERPCLLDTDCFGLLVGLVLALPNIFEVQVTKKETLEQHVLLMMLYAQVTTLLVSSPPNDMDDMETDDTADNTFVQEAVKLVRTGIEGVPADEPWTWWQVKNQCIPFLRKAALFFHYLHNKRPSAELSQLGGDTFENLCKYLSLPSSASDLLNSPTYKELLEETGWTSHPRIAEYLKSEAQVALMKTPGLVHLAQDYSELINLVSAFTCPHSDKDVSRNPTMCLVCGEMLCSQSYCCQQSLNKTPVGACSYHAHRCGAGVGIFMRIRECEVLIIASQGRGCFITAPYLDRYGETDQGLRRGNPLRLCSERYQKLQRMWLGHQLYEEMARYAESGNILLGTPWQHL